MQSDKKSKLVQYKDKSGKPYPYLFVNEKSGVFYAYKRVSKTRFFRKSLGKNFPTARKLLLEYLGKSAIREPTKRLLLEDYWRELMAQKRILGARESTLKRNQTVWDLSLHPFWGHVVVEDINQQKVSEYMSWHERFRKGIQYKNDLKNLGSLFNYLKAQGHIYNVPTLSIPLDEQRHHRAKKGRIFTRAEVDRILAHSDFKTAMLVRLGYFLGMRKMEIGLLLKSNVTKKDGRYFINLDSDSVKTGIPRIIPIPTKIQSDFERLLTLDSSKYLFHQKSNQNKPAHSQVLDTGWKKAKKAAEITNKARFHDLRHTCATNFAKAKISPILACTILGMSMATYQKTYLQLSGEDLIEAVDELGEIL